MKTRILLDKCPKCGANVFDGQLFCSACGVKLKTVMRTKEEVEALRDRLEQLDLNSLPSVAMFISVIWVLRWVLGEVSDELLGRFLEALEGTK